MKFFLAGIKGSGTASLACMLHELGHDVSGCDKSTYYTFTEEELKQRNIPYYLNTDTEKITKDMIFIYSQALNDKEPEMIKAKELNLESYTLAEYIAILSKNYNTICIAGTHGKTTTTSMISDILENTIGASYIIGDGRGHINKNSSLMVIEADEFKKKFLLYTPTYSIITNIEYDHVDIYKDINEISNTFQEFVNNTKEKVLVYGDTEETRKLKSDKIIYYGTNDNNDVIAKNIELTPNGSNFDVYINNNFYHRFHLNIYGMHMLLNSLACIYICSLLDIDKETIAKYINEFKNAKRRYEEENINDVIIVDDYAHHPTEVKTVIETSRQKYPDKEMVLVLIPYTLSRTKAFYKEFADVLKLCDKAYITDIEAAREDPKDFEGITSDLILDLVPKSEHISKETIDKLYKHNNAVIAFLGCKDPTWLTDAYKKGL